MNSVNRDPSQASAADLDTPQFAQVFRGYDKDAVDVFVRVIGQRLETERQRADRAEAATQRLRDELSAAERQSAPPSFENLGAEAARVLEQAGQSANVLLEQAKNRAAAIVKEAEVKAAAMLEQAQQRATDAEQRAKQALEQAEETRNRRLEEAHRDAERVRAEAEEHAQARRQETETAIEEQQRRADRDRSAVDADIERLRDYRDRIRSHLGQIHGDLATLLEAAAARSRDDDPGEAPASEARGEKGEPAAEAGERGEGDEKPGEGGHPVAASAAQQAQAQRRDQREVAPPPE